jgi:hypothetical protein
MVELSSQGTTIQMMEGNKKVGFDGLRKFIVVVIIVTKELEIAICLNIHSNK